MPQQLTIVLILVGILGLFISGRIRHDMVALIGLLACVMMGLVEPREAFMGFGHPATVTVGLVLILSYALMRSGVIDPIERLLSKTSDYCGLNIILLVVFAAILSMFINNVAALALFMPIAIATCRKVSEHPSRMLMPLSFGSILGGLGTLIGTPPNVIIATYRETSVGEAFGMFDFMPVGGVVAVVGILFVTTVGRKLISIKNGGTGAEDLFEIESYFSEVKVPKESKLVGMSISEIDEATADLDLVIFSLIHNKSQFASPSPNRIVEAGDVLLIEGSHEIIDKFVSKYSLEITAPEKVDKAALHAVDADTIEVVVSPQSNIQGRIVQNIRMKRRFGIALLAVSRQGKPYRGRLKDFKIGVGDVLLIHGEPEKLNEAVGAYGLLPLAERQLDLGRRKQDAPLAAVFFLGAIVLAATGVFPIQIDLAIAVCGMILFKVIPVREIYTKIDWPVIVLLGAMIPVGQALEGTGATQSLVTGILKYGSGLSPIMMLALILVITMTLSDILNNAATAILMAPIGVLLAKEMGTNPDAFLMAVAVGASCAFLTPIGHQNNVLIMGPGGYKFGDYWRLGLPLEIIIVMVAVPALGYFWPL